MEIIIKAQCPNCREEVEFSNKCRILNNKKMMAFNEEALIGDSFFDIVKRATLRQNNPFENSLSRLIKPVRLIRNYFDSLSTRINLTYDKEELLRLSKKLGDMGVVVSEQIQSEIKKQKPKVLALIKRKIKEFKKIEKKSKGKKS